MTKEGASGYARHDNGAGGIGTRRGGGVRGVFTLSVSEASLGPPPPLGEGPGDEGWYHLSAEDNRE